MKKLVAILALCLTCVFCIIGFTACGDDKPDNANQALTKAQLSASYKLVAKTAWAKLGFENVLEEKNAATLSAYSASFPETGVKLTEGTFNWAALRGNAGASVALINMIGDYYKNENFVITDKVVSFEIEDVHYSSSGEQLRIPSTLFIRPKIDAVNKKVDVELRIKNEQYDNYYYFDLGFDFETETLEYFVFGLHVMGTYSMQKMDTNGDFYFANDGGADGAEMLPSAEFKAEVDRLEAEFKTAVADGLTLTGNFQNEYDNFGTVSSKIFFESVNSVSDQGNGSGSGQGDENKIVLTSDTDFSALVSERLTKIEWQKAFSEYSFDNCTIKHENEHYNNRADFRYAEVRDGNQCVMFELYENSAFNGQSYHTVVGNEYSEYTKEEENAEFIKFVLSVNEYEDDIAWQMSYTFIMPTFADFYDDFTYSDSDNAYVYHGDEGLSSNSPMEGWNMNYTNIVIKFINGKVACISADRVGYDDGIYEWYVFDYGTTSVVLPETFIEETDLEQETTMTEQEFLAELEDREERTLADDSLHYATADCTLNGETIDTFELIYEENLAYVEIATKHYNVLGLSNRISGLLDMLGEARNEAQFKREGDNLEFSFEQAEYNVYFRYVFDENGYLTYRYESDPDGKLTFVVNEYYSEMGDEEPDQGDTEPSADTKTLTKD